MWIILRQGKLYTLKDSLYSSVSYMLFRRNTYPFYTQRMKNKPALKNLQFKKTKAGQQHEEDKEQQLCNVIKTQSLSVTIPSSPFVLFPQPDLTCHQLPYNHLTRRDNRFSRWCSSTHTTRTIGSLNTEVCTKTGVFRRKVRCRTHLLGQRWPRSSSPALSILWRVEFCLLFQTVGKRMKLWQHKEECASATIPLFLRKGEGRQPTANVGPGAQQCPVWGKQQPKSWPFSLENPGDSCWWGIHKSDFWPCWGQLQLIWGYTSFHSKEPQGLFELILPQMKFVFKNLSLNVFMLWSISSLNTMAQNSP